MVKSKNGYNLVNISRDLLKNCTGHLINDPKPYVKYENPSCTVLKLSCLQGFHGRVKKGAQLCHIRADRKKYMFAYFL